jgi:hypothetical protein
MPSKAFSLSRAAAPRLVLWGTILHEQTYTTPYNRASAAPTDIAPRDASAALHGGLLGCQAALLKGHAMGIFAKVTLTDRCLIGSADSLLVDAQLRNIRAAASGAQIS